MESIPSSDKLPEKYDEYKFTLSTKYKDIAAKALRENELIRSQALTQMREWIAKDPYIKQCRTDANFLLRFLRTKKFNVPDACAMLQRYLINRALYPQWFKNLDIDDTRAMQLMKEGFIIPLPEKDGMHVFWF